MDPMTYTLSLIFLGLGITSGFILLALYLSDR